MSLPMLSLFTGYGGLDKAVASLLDTHLVGVSDIDSGPCKVLDHHYPDAPNIGDIKAVDWDSLPPFDVLTGGYPCQPFSSAGARRGAEDPRHLWPNVLEGIQARRPSHVFLENVRGHLSLGFNQVLEDLALAGYSASWSIMAASSIGAAHMRERLYIYATPVSGSYELGRLDKVPSAGHMSPAGYTFVDRVDKGAKATYPLLPTPVARDRHGAATAGELRRQTVPLRALAGLLPTPPAEDRHGTARTAETRRKSPALRSVPALLPTPNTMDNLPARSGEARERQLRRGGEDSRRSTMGNLREDIVLTVDPLAFVRDNPAPTTHDLANVVTGREWDPFNSAEWGRYALAIARWTLVTGHLPPAPLELNKAGNPWLTAEFPAWLMGLEPGYLTDPAIGLTRAEAIKLAGNGVVPHAAAAAFAAIMDRHYTKETA